MQNNSENGTSNQKYPEVVFLCSCGQGCKRIVVKDIVYIEAMKDNCRVYMSDSSRYHLTCPMKDIEDTLDPTRFIKIHRSFIVNLNLIKVYFYGYVVMITIIEFANCFVSVVCALNGRKVMTWIMKKAKRTMI